MIKLERTEVMNIKNAIRGMRNPLNSWHKSDSGYCYDIGCDRNDIDSCSDCDTGTFILGENDLNLAKRLCNAGSDHRKFLRQIFVSVDITAPLYWWKEYDTYKVGTVANSTSTMHKIHAKELTLDDFSFDVWHMTPSEQDMICTYIEWLEGLRKHYLEDKNKLTWRTLIQSLPSSYNQMRTCTLNYENLRNMYHSRKNHKLDEWHGFCEWVETLPYAKEFIIG